MGVIRKTKSVKTILDIFKDSTNAIAVTDLVAQLSGQMNKTTIYRILTKLEEDGILHAFLGKKGNKWYAKCKGCSTGTHHDMHPHFQCLDCGKVECIETRIDIEKIENRKVIVSQVLLQGTCETCNQKGQE